MFESPWYDLHGWLGVKTNYLSIYLQVAGQFSEQDTVRVRGDADLLKLLNTRVGWKTQMDSVS